MLSKIFRNFISYYKFSQFIVSKIFLTVPIFIPHNISKYNILNKIIYIISIDDIKGDYTEFGCFTGSCLIHANRCFDKYFKDSKSLVYGFDSFEGFPDEVHSEFKSKNFTANYDRVKFLENKYSRIKIVKGFFSESLNDNLIKKKIETISLAFIIIDDYFNLDRKNNSIQYEFLKKFQINKNVFQFKEFGISGIAFRYKKI